jgi:L-malate glycosyltransferase
MRILYFTRGYTPHDRRFLSKLAESRHDVWFLPLEDHAVASNHELPAGVKLAKWHEAPGKNIAADACLPVLPAFEKLVSQIEPDLVHAGPIQSCGFIAAMSGFHPFLAMSWGSDILMDSEKDDFWRWITCYTLRRSDMLLCDCNAVRIKAESLVGYPAQRTVQIPWGVDLEAFFVKPALNDVRSELGWKDAYVALSTRSWEPIYGIEVVLSAFQKAHSREQRMRLILLGSGSLSAQIESFIRRHELTAAVYMPGAVDPEAVPDFYRASDIYISSTHSDGTSVSLLEAMTSGLPLIVTDIPANREWVQHGVNGWLAADGDADEFARLLLLAAGLATEDRHRIASRNRRIVEERADWRRNFERLLEAYRDLETGGHNG